MKYLFQQMIAFWAIILTILVVVGVSFTQFTKKTIIENSYSQMAGYARSVLEISKNSPENLLPNIGVVELITKNQEVTFFYVNAEKKIEYPTDVRGKETTFISDENWIKIKDDTPVKVEVSTPQNGRLTQGAMYVQPLFVMDQEGTHFVGALAVVQPIKIIEKSMGGLTENLFKGFLISSIIALVFSYAIAQLQVNRINRMKRATKQISEGNFDVDLEVKGNDELDELAQDFNNMAIALKESNEEIQRQEDKRRQFMADAAHEMRTPLTTINGLLEGLAYKVIPKAQEEKSIDLMRNETNRLIRLVNENLDYEKIRTNQISMVIQKFNATETMASIVAQLSNKAKLAGNTLTLETKESIDAYADYDRFVQIMVNIIQNAIQFTNEGKITVSLEKGYLETTIIISDTGIGMTEEEVKNVWERYYKVDASRKNTKYGESGLGLSIVHSLVELHHGSIRVESEKDIGSTFYITFPDVDMKQVGARKLSSIGEREQVQTPTGTKE